MTNLSDNQILAISIITKLFDTISIISCSFIVFLFLKQKQIRSFAMTIVFQLCICSIIAHFVILIIQTSHLKNEKGEQTIACNLQSTFLTTFDSALLIWTTCLAVIACFSFTNPSYMHNNRLYVKVFIVVCCWIYPIIWGIL